MKTDDPGLQVEIKATRNNVTDAQVTWWTPPVSSMSWNRGCEIKVRFHVARNTQYVFPFFFLQQVGRGHARGSVPYCGIMLLYPVKICHSCWFNKMLIDQ